MNKVMFVCLGNICRSPMAEYIFRKIVSERGGDFAVASSATSSEEAGNGVYPPAAAMLARHGIRCGDKRAVQFTRSNYNEYDLIVCMERRNVSSLLRMMGGDPDGKICRLLDFTDSPRDIADPWFTRDFEAAYEEIAEGCQVLYETLTRTERESISK